MIVYDCPTQLSNIKYFANEISCQVLTCNIVVSVSGLHNRANAGDGSPAAKHEQHHHGPGQGPHLHTGQEDNYNNMNYNQDLTY